MSAVFDDSIKNQKLNKRKLNLHLNRKLILLAKYEIKRIVVNKLWVIVKRNKMKEVNAFLGVINRKFNF